MQIKKMNFKKYKFREYNEKYPMLFKKEKSKLKKIFPKNAVIEHIGSTAIPNLGGKGVIDLYVTVKNKEIKNTKKKLISNN